jgi:predicted nucleic acid-binding protein
LPETLSRAPSDSHPIYDLVYVALAEGRRTQLVTAVSTLRRTLVGLDRLIAPGGASPLTKPK